MSRRLLLFLGGLGALAACTLITGADRFKVVERACNFCSATGLAHAPCPSSAGPGGGDRVLTFALRSIDLGADPARWDAGQAVGLDLDCSARPDGRPPLCVQPAGTVQRPLPDGIDNSLALTLAAVVNGGSLGADLEQALRAELDAGLWSEVLIIEGWNGTPDDDAVGVRLLFSRGVTRVAGEADVWSAVSPGYDDAGLPSTPFSGGEAYVAGGQLVWDARSVKGGVLRLQRHEDHGIGAVDIALAGATLVGELHEDSLHATLAGVWPTGSANLWPDFLAGRDPARACEIRAAYNAYSQGWGGPIVADMPSPGNSPALPDCDGGACLVPCGSISVGFGLDFVAVSNVVADPTQPLPARPGPVQCDGG